MATFWLPAALHCAVDQAGLFDSAPACCDHEEDRAPDDRACSERCAVFDRGINKTSTENPTLSAPVLLVLVDRLVPIEVKLAVTPAGLAKAADSPPELARTWQFVARAALPPRAPSKLS